MRILSNAAMREVERVAIEELGVPSILLMENAALGVLEAALDFVPQAETAAVFCGPGNNGGDGLAVARHLASRGVGVTVVVATSGREYAGDARVHFEIARNMGGLGLELRMLSTEAEVPGLMSDLREVDLFIDALFGTGLSRPLEGLFAKLVEAINELGRPTIAVDLPSGLNGDVAEAPGPHVRADLTVAFEALRPALVFPPASEAVGDVVIADLGIPSRLTQRTREDLFLLEAGDLAPLLTPRPSRAHKGDFGHVLVVAGGPGKSGAAVLAAQAAVRAGAGLVTAAVPEAVLESFEAASIETMSLGLPVGPDGGLAESAHSLLEAGVEGKQAVAVGPGLGTEPGTGEAIRAFCLRVELPLVLDADGLNAFAGRLGELTARSGATVLTPHPGELGRLLGVSTKNVVADRLGSARRAAEESGAVVLLKGQLTLIADPEAGVYVNPTGNPGMATGGSGDVLTGLIGALLAQGMDAASAAQLGAWVHGAAGDSAAEATGERSLAAGDLLDLIPAAFQSLTGEESSSAVGRAGTERGGDG